MRIELVGRRPLLRRLCPVEPENGSLVLDSRRLTFASPLDLAAIVSLARAAGSRGEKVRLITPRDHNVASYLERLDVISSLPPGTDVVGELPGGPRMDLPDRLLEVTHLTPGGADRLGERMGRMLTRHYGDLGRRYFAGVGELIDNAISHGWSGVGAFVAAQVYTGATSGLPGIEFAVCDTGIGVRAHLGHNVADDILVDDVAALETALEPGVTGTREERGHGLNDLWRAVPKGGLARLQLRSGKGLASVVGRGDSRRPTCVSADVDVAGTWASLRVHPY
ncbi:hypothetical protein [Amycolatopsis sp. EV170708-02-1]|uniref:hypothetical protein n=1 Tax=Amycolatopsis sp. EV170708-02-1 TaxID=2919322 RepID=UPI001F0C00FA|nr:hypothetical protein [Amycolatopsis sp. EV170708-02-1]UMP01264.1 hypothetical protein MJQ72_33225 [Amycolatopsis sp. EV170708-02-1]